MARGSADCRGSRRRWLKARDGEFAGAQDKEADATGLHQMLAATFHMFDESMRGQ
jgi:hypothetical protein